MQIAIFITALLLSLVCVFTALDHKVPFRDKVLFLVASAVFLASAYVAAVRSI